MPIEFQFNPKLKDTENGREIFDPVRKKWIILTPEEWVRQYYIGYLNEVSGFPVSLMKSEIGLGGSGRAKRTDLVLHGTRGQVLMLCEFKRKGEKLDDKVVFQAARYNKELKAKHILISNGDEFRVIRIDQSTGELSELDAVPLFEQLT